MCTHLDKTGSTYYFRRTVPDDLRGHFTTATGKPRTEWKFSLRTKDREEAKRRLRPFVADTDRFIDEARAHLANRTEAASVDPVAERLAQEAAEMAAQLAAEKAARQEARAPERLRLRRRLSRSTAEMDPRDAAVADLMREKDATIAKLQAAQAAGSSPVPNRSVPTQIDDPAASITALFERYATSGSANPKTVAKWRSRVAALVAFLGHNDVRRVSRADLNRWVEGLVGKSLAKKTIEAGYLPPIKLTLGLAVDDELIATNPASGLKVRAPKPVKLRDRDLGAAEAETILRAAMGPQPARLDDKHALARRWVPWLCAYTGARVAEITQLRAMDVRCEQGIWVLHITPEAGSVKTYEARTVPLHPHLISQGFVSLAKEGDATPLFYTEGTGNAVNPASKMRASHLAKWVRALGVTVPQPFHGWRHRFKTVARTVGIEEYLTERLLGHAPSNAAGNYGTVPLTALRDAVNRLPAYQGEGLPPFAD